MLHYFIGGIASDGCEGIYTLDRSGSNANSGVAILSLCLLGDGKVSAYTKSLNGEFIVQYMEEEVGICGDAGKVSSIFFEGILAGMRLKSEDGGSTDACVTIDFQLDMEGELKVRLKCINLNINERLCNDDIKTMLCLSHHGSIFCSCDKSEDKHLPSLSSIVHQPFLFFSNFLKFKLCLYYYAFSSSSSDAHAYLRLMQVPRVDDGLSPAVFHMLQTALLLAAKDRERGRDRPMMPASGAGGASSSSSSSSSSLASVGGMHSAHGPLQGGTQGNADEDEDEGESDGRGGGEQANPAPVPTAGVSRPSQRSRHLGGVGLLPQEKRRR